MKKEAKNFCGLAAVYPPSARARVQKFFGSFLVTAQVTDRKQRQAAGRPSFLKKRSKKLLSHPEKPQPKQIKVFLLRFLQKKKAFLPLASAAGHPPGQLPFLQKRTADS